MNEVKFKANIKDLAALQATVSEIPEIPTPESTDEGKVLTVAVDSSGETPVVSYELEEVDALPTIGSGDAGKVLTVNAGETAAEWASVPAELPAIGDTDAGKVLTVNSGHTGVEWAAGAVSSVHVFTVYSKTIPQDITSSFTISSSDIPSDLTLDNIITLLNNNIIPVILLHRLNSAGEPLNQYHIFYLSEHRAKGGEVFATPYTQINQYTGYARIKSINMVITTSGGEISGLFVRPTQVDVQLFTST